MDGCEVRLYALSTCIHCQSTKELLDRCGVDYECIDVDKLDGEERQNVLEDIKKVNPGCSFPTIIIGNKIIVGFRADEIKEALHL